jgi:hypothetical protein
MTLGAVRQSKLNGRDQSALTHRRQETLILRTHSL